MLKTRLRRVPADGFPFACLFTSIDESSRPAVRYVLELCYSLVYADVSLEGDMADETFEMFVQRERARSHGEREAIFTEQRELETKLADINRQLMAIDAYEAARTGKAVPARQGARRSPQQARRGSRREELLKIIKEGGGLTRGEILERMGLKGNKSDEMSVSNALTALTKANHVQRNSDRKYVVA